MLLASGFSLKGEEEEILGDECNGFIQKPFKIEQLSMLIQEILNKERQPNKN